MSWELCLVSNLIDMFKQLATFLFGKSHTISFDPDSPIIEIPVSLKNGEHQLFTSFALDTGASYTVIDDGLVSFLDLEPSSQGIEISTASGTETAGLVDIPLLTVAGLKAYDSPALITQLPEESGVTGLLGLSFLKEFEIKINFEKGEVRIS